MTLKEMEIAIKNLQHDVKNLASRNFTGKVEDAKAVANTAKKVANDLSDEIESANRKTLDTQIALEEFLTDTLPEILEGGALDG